MTTLLREESKKGQSVDKLIDVLYYIKTQVIIQYQGNEIIGFTKMNERGRGFVYFYFDENIDLIYEIPSNKPCCMLKGSAIYNNNIIPENIQFYITEPTEALIVLSELKNFILNNYNELDKKFKLCCINSTKISSESYNNINFLEDKYNLRTRLKSVIISNIEYQKRYTSCKKKLEETSIKMQMELKPFLLHFYKNPETANKSDNSNLMTVLNYKFGKIYGYH